MIELPGEPRARSWRPCSSTRSRSPGSLLYRFDAVIANQGGTLDLFRGRRRAGGRRCGRAACRRRRRSPTRLPTGPESDRSGFGAGSSTRTRRRTSTALLLAARYELQPPGGPARPSTRSASACSTPTRPRRATTSASRCRGGAARPGARFDARAQATVRMGLSPGGADLYSAQREFQWVDISGLAPGPATVRGQANPLHCVARERRGQQHDERGARDPGRARGRRGGRAGRADAVGHGRGAGRARAAQRRLRAGARRRRAATCGRRRQGR